MRPIRKSKIWRIAPALSVMAVICCSSTLVKANTIAEINDLEPEELVMVAFEIQEDMDVRIEAVGGRSRNNDRMYGYPWIIDATTRQVVWSMDEEFSRRFEGSTYLREIDDDIELAKGMYELYFYSGHLSGSIKIDALGDLKDLLKDLLGSRDKYSDRELTGEFYVRLTSDSDQFRKITRESGPPPATIAIIEPDNDAYEHQGFVLDREVELVVYCGGEYSEWSEMMVDWGWIVDAPSRERVWEMDRWNSDWAGGAEKNRVAKETITLPAGEYIAYYVTDDSHTYGDWNENPPYDPEAWGLRIWPVNPRDADAIRPADIEFEEDVVVEMTRVCDNEFLSQGIRLKSPTELHIYAIGEDDRYSDRLADHGWISDAETGRRVWKMDDDNTEYAGGATKNRKFDGMITLDEGEYVVHYATDGSHSYCDWNASPPYDQRAYGITISVGKGMAAENRIELWDSSRGPAGALASITCVTDNERRKQRFSLEKVTRVRIRALGEGDRDDMYDYGWIENADDGTVSWEMTYRKTVNGGGADKNRLVNQTVLLDKGNYVVYYVTDGSHSCNDWNDDPPDDPFAWGIIITEEK